MRSRYSTNDMPGPGDPETWPPYTGHPNDPRADDEEDEVEDPRIEQIEAERARR